MTRTSRAAVSAIREVVEPLGCTVDVVHGGKHDAAVITAPDGRWCKIAHSSQAYDEVAQAHWSAQDARRQMEAWGLLTGPDVPPPHRPRRRPPSTRNMALASIRVSACVGGPARDPWAPLREWGS